MYVSAQIMIAFFARYNTKEKTVWIRGFCDDSEEGKQYTDQYAINSTQA